MSQVHVHNLFRDPNKEEEEEEKKKVANLFKVFKSKLDWI